MPFFDPITVFDKDYQTLPFLSRKRSPFSDIRFEKTREELSQVMEDKQTINIRALAEDSNQADRFHRFLSSPKVETSELIHRSCQIPAEVVKGKHVLNLSDTSSYNLGKSVARFEQHEAARQSEQPAEDHPAPPRGHGGRFTPPADQGLGRGNYQIGVLQDGKTPGTHVHASLAVEQGSGAILGLSDVIYYNRPDRDACRRDGRPRQDKESHKWELGCTNASKVLSAADRISHVMDREADDFYLFHHVIHELGDDLVVRAKHNRLIINDKGGEVRLFDHLSNSPLRRTYELDLPKLNHYSTTNGKRVLRAARKARIELRFEKVTVAAPKDGELSGTSLDLYVIEAREVDADLPPGQEPLLWRIWTTHVVKTVEQAMTAINIYLCRWKIEQLFRTTKKKGFNAENTQVDSYSAWLNQLTIALTAGTKILQLVYARDGDDDQPISNVFTEEEQDLLVKINRTVQGKTKKKSNPHPRNKLAFGSWVIARLGGWSGYQSRRPPGPLTMKRGLERFMFMLLGSRLMTTL
ncbi:MAG: IS4 family transposase [Saprospiraceae bacterium]